MFPALFSSVVIGPFIKTGATSRTPCLCALQVIRYAGHT